MSCIGSSSASSSDSDLLSQQISPLPVVAATPSLRTWRLTNSGLVEVADGTMGAFLDKPKTAKTNTSGQGNGLRYAMASMQGWRVDMEDAHVVEVSMGDQDPYKDWSFFAVFDGHAGNIAADDAAANILQTLISTPQFEQVTNDLKATNGVLCANTISKLEAGIKSGFLILDQQIKVKLDQDRSGSTAVCAILTPTHIIIANLGDSRAVISRRDEPSFGTIDHKPYHEREKERIVGAGGSVMIQRINGSLAVSRALGDFEYKNVPGLEPTRQLVSPEPDVYVLERHTDKDEFMVLACDGIYDVMENEELCSFVRSRLEVDDNLSVVCNQVLDECLLKGSRDNMTMIVICFENAPRIEEIRKEEERIFKEKATKVVEDIIDAEIAKPDYQEELSVEYVRRLLNNHPEVQQPQGLTFFTVAIIQEVMAAKGVKDK